MPSAAAAVDKRAAILDAALVTFVERTYAGTTVPQVAEAAGVATGTIYRYFPSKEALVNALYRRWKGELRDRLLAAPATGDPREAFHHWWGALTSFVLEHPDAFAFLEMHHHEPYLDAESRQAGIDVDTGAIALIARGQAAGAIRPLPPPLVMALVYGAFIGIVRGLRSYGDLFDARSFALAEDAVWDLVRTP